MRIFRFLPPLVRFEVIASTRCTSYISTELDNNYQKVLLSNRHLDSINVQNLTIMCSFLRISVGNLYIESDF